MAEIVLDLIHEKFNAGDWTYYTSKDGSVETVVYLRHSHLKMALNGTTKFDHQQLVTMFMRRNPGKSLEIWNDVGDNATKNSRFHGKHTFMYFVLAIPLFLPGIVYLDHVCKGTQFRIKDLQ